MVTVLFKTVDQTFLFYCCILSSVPSLILVNILTVCLFYTELSAGSVC